MGGGITGVDSLANTTSSDWTTITLNKKYKYLCIYLSISVDDRILGNAYGFEPYFIDFDVLKMAKSSISEAGSTHTYYMHTKNSHDGLSGQLELIDNTHIRVRRQGTASESWDKTYISVRVKGFY